MTPPGSVTRPSPGADAGSRARGLPGWVPLLLVLASYCFVPLYMRGSVLAEYSVEFAAADLRGVLSDLWLVAILFTIQGLLRNKLQKVVVLLLYIPLYAFSYTNYEYVKQLQSNLDLIYLSQYVTDPTFLAGSIFCISQLELFITGIVISLPPLLLAMFLRHRRLARWKVALVPLLLTAVVLLWPTDDDSQKWRQYNFLHQNLVAAPQRDVLRTFKKKEEIPAALQARLAPRVDLSGKPRFKFGPGQNVLLIMLESVSGTFWDALSTKHNKYRKVAMPRLNRRVARGLLYKNYIANQRQTRRGIFTFLCGEYPNFATKDAKTVYHGVLGGQGPTCLPRYLNQAGYRTVYIQADSLAFNAKGQFLKHAGFAEYHGFQWFDRAYRWTGWGPDDLAFFEGVVKKLDSLANQPGPWFLAAINVGTHHPYQVPESFKSKYPDDSFAKAVDYLDHSMAYFLDTIRKRGYLDNTLVIITSDESRGINPGLRALTVSLSNNWIPLAVLTPQQQTGVVSELFSQKDLTISVLDYLGLAHKAEGIRGRSFFRSYDTRETIFLGNTYTMWLGAFFADNTLLHCNQDMYRCKEYQFSGVNFLRDNNFTKKPSVSRERLDLLNAFITLNDKSYAELMGARQIKLIERQEVVVHSQPFQQMIFGQQYLVLDKGSAAQVDLELTVEQGQLKLEHYFTGYSTRHLRQFSTRELSLSKGQRLTVSYKIGVGSTLPSVQIKLLATNNSGKPARLKITRATLKQSREQHSRTRTLWSRVKVVP